jgi:uncharacterized protein (TIGR02996 family)
MFDSEERSQIRAILADPEAPAPRLAYADWLAQRGDDRAEAVRVGTHLKMRDRQLFESELELDWQTNELRAKLHDSIAWRKHLPRVDGVAWRKAEGGLIEQIAVTKVAAFRRRAGEILDVQPVHRFECNAKDDEGFITLLGSPEMARLGALYLGGNYNGPGVARAVAASSHIAHLRCLDLSFSTIGDEGATRLAGAAHLASLQDLTLVRNELSDEGLRALCGAPQLAPLQRLRLGWNELGPRACDILAASPFSNLRDLGLDSNPHLGAEGIVRLIESGRLANAQWLNLAHSELGPAAGEALFSGACPRLARVNYVGNTTDDGVLAALAGCQLAELRDLRCELHGKIGPATADRLAHAPWLPQLERLTIRDNGSLRYVATALAGAALDRLEQLHWHCFSKDAWSHPLDEAVAQLARNPTLGNLRILELHAPLTEASVEPIAHLASLRMLALPSELADHTSQLAAALPSCKIKTTAYVRER